MDEWNVTMPNADPQAMFDFMNDEDCRRGFVEWSDYEAVCDDRDAWRRKTWFLSGILTVFVVWSLALMVAS